MIDCCALIKSCSALGTLLEISIVADVELTENDIPGATLGLKQPEELKVPLRT